MRILIVDDEQTVVEFLSQAAAAKGHTNIETASSGEEALAQVIRGSFDLITLDIRMPGASGLEVLSPVRNLCPHAIIAIISGHIPEESIQDLAGCADLIIEKPINLATFMSLLENTALIWETMQKIQLLGTIPTTVRETS